MNTFIVLLRGVMPSGKNRVPMAQLREVLSEAGFLNVKTYIQSGNILLETRYSAGETAELVHELIKKHIGADLKIIVRTGQQLKKVLEQNPFKTNHDLSRVFFVLFSEPPPAEKINELAGQDFGEEKLVIDGTSAYMYIPGNAARSKLSNVMLEKKLATDATTRNFNTLNKLVEMSLLEK